MAFTLGLGRGGHPPRCVGGQSPSVLAGLVLGSLSVLCHDTVPGGGCSENGGGRESASDRRRGPLSELCALQESCEPGPVPWSRKELAMCVCLLPRGQERAGFGDGALLAATGWEWEEGPHRGLGPRV